MKVVSLNVQDAHKYLQDNPDTIILDVRTPDEFELFYIKGALNIDAQEKYFKLALGQLDTEKTYLVHCHSGERSTKAIDILQEIGFTNLVHMHEGMREWNHAKLPVVYNWTI